MSQELLKFSIPSGLQISQNYRNSSNISFMNGLSLYDYDNKNIKELSQSQYGGALGVTKSNVVNKITSLGDLFGTTSVNTLTSDQSVTPTKLFSDLNLEEITKYLNDLRT
jgi:hypothetical protein